MEADARLSPNAGPRVAHRERADAHCAATANTVTMRGARPNNRGAPIGERFGHHDFEPDASGCRSTAVSSQHTFRGDEQMTHRDGQNRMGGTLPRAASWALATLLLLFTAQAISQESGYLVEEYKIGPEDVLDISVWKEPELTRQVLVRPDGGISFPLAGDIQAAGKTTSEIQQIITERLRRFIPEAVVSVSAAKLAGYRIYVLGKVNNPGQFVPGRYVDVLQALTLAGGLTPYASRGSINIVRRTGDQLATMPFDFGDVEDGRNLDQNILLESGDVVVVP